MVLAIKIDGIGNQPGWYWQSNWMVLTIKLDGRLIIKLDGIDNQTGWLVDNQTGLLVDK